MKNVVLSLLILGAGLCADSLKFSVQGMEMKYVETGRSGEFLNKQTSSISDINGLGIEYGYDIGNFGPSVMLSLDYLKGDSAYDGFLQDTSGNIVSPYQTNTKMKIVEPKIRLQQQLFTGDVEMNVFASLANRDWTRDIQGQYGYLEEYEWAYADVGTRFLFKINRARLGIEFAYKYAFDPKLYAAFNGGMNFNLGTTKGYTLEVPMIVDLNRAMAIELSYKLDNWSISHSNVVNGYYEPDSETDNQILKLSFLLKW